MCLESVPGALVCPYGLWESLWRAHLLQYCHAIMHIYIFVMYIVYRWHVYCNLVNDIGLCYSVHINVGFARSLQLPVSWWIGYLVGLLPFFQLMHHGTAFYNGQHCYTIMLLVNRVTMEFFQHSGFFSLSSYLGDSPNAIETRTFCAQKVVEIGRLYS